MPETQGTLHLDRWGINMVLPNQSVQQPNRVKNMLGLQDVVQATDPEPKRELTQRI